MEILFSLFAVELVEKVIPTGKCCNLKQMLIKIRMNLLYF